MPQTDRRKWQTLAEEMEWQHSILELRKYVLITLQALSERNAKVANGGLTYWFGPYPENSDTAWRNTHVRCRDVIITHHKLMRQLEETTHKSLIWIEVSTDPRNEQELIEQIGEALEYANAG